MADSTATSGIHRAKLWQIAGFALNNTATNFYLYFLMYISYYMVGLLGVATVLASSVVMMMRIWDGVTDPFIGLLVDKTNSKFGKNRPFFVIGNVILAVTSWIMFHVIHTFSNTAMRFPFFIVIYLLYIIGYTFQCVVTKSGQTCLTSDPKQSPLFGVFDGIYGVFLALIASHIVVNLTDKYNGEFTPAFFHDYWVITVLASAALTVIAILSLWSKDNIKYFGTGKPVKVGFKDYWEVLKHNRAIQMLVVSASTDKLAMQINSNATVHIILYGIVCGNFALYRSITAYTTIPNIIFLVIGLGGIATLWGQKRSLLIGSIGSLVCNIVGAVLFLFGNPTSLSFPGLATFAGWNAFTIIYLISYVGNRGFTQINGAVVITMTADCADYEVARSGRYVPGLMGTLFSFVDKLISSLATTLVGLMVASIGFTTSLPKVDIPYSDALLYIGVFCMFGTVIIGLICNLIALKFYPLTKEKMEEVQAEIGRIKAEAAKA